MDGGGYPQGPGFQGGPGIRGGHEMWFRAGHILPVVLLLVMLGLLIWLLVRVSRMQRGAALAPAMAGVPAAAMAMTPGPDPALAELRLRYARGDMTREDYLERAGDLGAPGDPEG
jgi:uncharacterized membrane protein